jgi:hypothetical protein
MKATRRRERRETNHRSLTLANVERPSEVTHDVHPPIRLGVFGDPAAHPLAPQMQNAALRAFKINVQYARLHIRPNELRAALGFVRELDFVGINLTSCSYVLDIAESLPATRAKETNPFSVSQMLH